MNEPRVVRFSPVERAFHLLYLVAFVSLALTGLSLYLAPLHAWATGDAGELGRIVHRMAAIVLVLGPVLYVVLDWRNFARSVRRILTWSAKDWTWMRTAPRFYWTGERRGIPPQGKYDTGQKLNALIQMVCFGVFVITGTLMWVWGPTLSPVAFRLSVILHDVAFVFAFGFFLVHVYLALLHPFTRAHINSMVDGTIQESAARQLYSQWYDEVRAAERSR